MVMEETEWYISFPLFFNRFLPFHNISYVLESVYSGISPEYWFRNMSNCYCFASWHSYNSPNYQILGIFGREHKFRPLILPTGCSVTGTGPL